MTIDEKYDLLPPPGQVQVPTSAVPDSVRERLLEALGETSAVWRDMEVNAFQDDAGVHLRVTMDLGDRPLHLSVHRQGTILHIDAPVLFNFPAEASHFVLGELSRLSPYLSLGFRIITAETAQEGNQNHPKDKEASRATEVLYAWGVYEYDMFVEAPAVLLYLMIAKIRDAGEKIQGLLARSAPVAELDA